MLTVVVCPGQAPSDRMVRLVRSVRASNADAGVEVVEVDIEVDGGRARELGVMVCPTVIVSIDGDERERLVGPRSHRALLQCLLPLLYDDDERAVAELRRQLSSPGERFPRRARRRAGRVSQQRRVEMLGAVDLFESLSKRQLKQLAQVAHEVVLDPDTTVITEGHPGDEFFLVVQGSLRVTRRGDPIARLSTGDGFGEMSLLDDLPRSATVTTSGAVTLLAIDRPTFRSLLTQAPEIAIALLASMSVRFRHRDAAHRTGS